VLGTNQKIVYLAMLSCEEFACNCDIDDDIADVDLMVRPEHLCVN